MRRGPVDRQCRLEVRQFRHTRRQRPRPAQRQDRKVAGPGIGDLRRAGRRPYDRMWWRDLLLRGRSATHHRRAVIRRRELRHAQDRPGRGVGRKDGPARSAALGSAQPRRGEGGHAIRRLGRGSSGGFGTGEGMKIDGERGRTGYREAADRAGLVLPRPRATRDQGDNGERVQRHRAGDSQCGHRHGSKCCFPHRRPVVVGRRRHARAKVPAARAS